MQKELNQFEKSKVQTLVPLPKGHFGIGTRWTFKNKLDESGKVVRNKARLIAQCYNQQEGIDYDETFAPIIKLEAIKMLLAFPVYRGFVLYQMDLKSTFLNGFIYEEVYVKQPPGFENETFPHHIFKLSKALYGLKQAPRDWYERFNSFLLKNWFKRGKVDTTLFIMHEKSDFLIVQIYVDDIIFGVTNQNLCKDFSKLVQGEFEMSMMGELKYFSVLQIKQQKDEILIHQEKYAKDLLKRFDMDKTKSINTPMHHSQVLEIDEKTDKVSKNLYRGMIGSLLYLTTSRPNIQFCVGICAKFQSKQKQSHVNAVKRIIGHLVGTTNLGLWHEQGTFCDVTGYYDVDFAGDRVERKNISGCCCFLGKSLITWSSKKQNTIALSQLQKLNLYLLHITVLKFCGLSISWRIST